VKAFLAEQKATQDAKETVDFLYCRRNPNGSVAEYQGKPRTCADVVEYTKAFCLVNPEAERCKLAKSKAQVEKAFASAIEDFKNDPRHTKKDTQGFYDEFFRNLTRWGCMSFPDMILPQRDGTEHRCPDAPEVAPAHADTKSQNK
jgi:sarcosine oxidase delta subunit